MTHTASVEIQPVYGESLRQIPAQGEPEGTPQGMENGNTGGQAEGRQRAAMGRRNKKQKAEVQCYSRARRNRPGGEMQAERYAGRQRNKGRNEAGGAVVSSERCDAGRTPARVRLRKAAGAGGQSKIR